MISNKFNIVTQLVLAGINLGAIHPGSWTGLANGAVAGLCLGYAILGILEELREHG